MLFLTACALCSALAVAPTASPTPVPAEIAHVYTSERADVTLKETARTTYVVTREQIERNGYRTIAQALYALPAITISPLGATGSGVNFSLRGSSSAQVLVLIDGLPAPGSFSNSVELGALPTTGVDRIEVVEGGGSTLYGTGSIGGIVNIITQRTAPFALTLRSGSFGDNEAQVSTPNMQFDRVVSHNGFGLPGGSARPDADFESSALHANVDRQSGAFDAALRLGIQSDHLGAPGPDSFLSISTRENDENANANLTLTHRSAQSQTTLQLGGTTQHILFWCDPAGDPNCFQPLAALSTEARVDLGLRDVVRSAHTQFLYGADFSRGSARGDNGGFAVPSIANGTFAQTAAYAQEHVNTWWGSYYGGVRAERDGVLGGEISPAAGFVWQTSRQSSLKGNVATAFRAPNASELYFPAYGNPALNPERAQVADLTFTDARVLGGASVGWFANRTRDLIIPEPVSAMGPSCPIDPASFTYQPCNVDHAFIEGLTLVVQTPQYRGIIASLNITDLYRAEDLETGARLPNDPVIGANLSLNYSDDSDSAPVSAAGINVHSAGQRGVVHASLPLFDQPVAYTSLDAYVRFRIAKQTLLSIRGLNLGNERYAAAGGFPMPGRSFVLELSVK